mgnify:FL=1
MFFSYLYEILDMLRILVDGSLNGSTLQVDPVDISHYCICIMFYKAEYEYFKGLKVI